MSAAETVRAFLAAINQRDVAAIRGLCSEDHRFVDAHGGVLSQEGVAAAWTGYFKFMPRYGVEADLILAEGDDVAVFGWAWGALDDAEPETKSWRRPCAWRAQVQGEKIRLWQVFVDTKAVFDLL